MSSWGWSSAQKRLQFYAIDLKGGIGPVSRCKAALTVRISAEAKQLSGVRRGSNEEGAPLSAHLCGASAVGAIEVKAGAAAFFRFPSAARSIYFVLTSTIFEALQVL